MKNIDSFTACDIIYISFNCRTNLLILLTLLRISACGYCCKCRNTIGKGLFSEELVEELIEGGVFADDGLDDIAVGANYYLCGEALDGVVGQH